MIKIEKVKDLNDFMAGRRILIVEDHDWKHEETDFVQMVNADGSVADPEGPPNTGLLMQVRTRFGTTLDLKSENAFVIEKKIIQRPDQN